MTSTPCSKTNRRYREDEKRKVEKRLETLMLEGLRSEDAEMTREDWSNIRKEARAQVSASKKRK